MQPRPAGPQLPSIRTLHPYLPAIGPGPSTSTSTYEPAQTGSGDERGVTGENEPPKKKRRRQALSCTGTSLQPILPFFSITVTYN
ncbi:hypothetical protein B0H14DRAFT_3518368 [Mycena olivaceomarginata]|nr:hypothetical protein B0H14DRAFT_3518368 [Mycena olivaceomarginata]